MNNDKVLQHILFRDTGELVPVGGKKEINE